MNKSKHEKNQITMITIALVLALAVIITAAYFVARAIQGNENVKDDGYFQKSSSSFKELDDSTFDEESSQIDGTSSSIVDSSDTDIQDETKPAEDFKVVDYIGYTTTDLLNDFGGEYEAYGYYNGGYFIYNYDVIPSFLFCVPVETEGDDVKLINQKINAMILGKNSYILDGVMVGMTYDELKAVCGDTISSTTDDDFGVQVAILKQNNFTANIEFDRDTGKSVMATIFFGE